MGPSPFLFSTPVAALSSWKMPIPARDAIGRVFRSPRAGRRRLLHARFRRERRHAVTHPHGPDAHQRDRSTCRWKNAAGNLAGHFSVRTPARTSSSKNSPHDCGRIRLVRSKPAIPETQRLKCAVIKRDKSRQPSARIFRWAKAIAPFGSSRKRTLMPFAGSAKSVAAARSGMPKSCCAWSEHFSCSMP